MIQCLEKKTEQQWAEAPSWRGVINATLMGTNKEFNKTEIQIFGPMRQQIPKQRTYPKQFLWEWKAKSWIWNTEVVNWNHFQKALELAIYHCTNSTGSLWAWHIWPRIIKKDLDVGPVLPELKALMNRFKGPETIWTERSMAGRRQDN